MKQSEVLIAGAGPTGLVLALWLQRQGVQVRVVDKAAQAGSASRALAVQARTLELYRQLDLADAVIAAGHKIPAFNLWTGGQLRARLPIGDIGAGLTPYPFLLIYPQDEHERLLEARLAGAGVPVERGCELAALAQREDGVQATLRGPAGEEQHASRFLVGCDGARSAVRQLLGVDFPGGTYEHVFYVADIEGRGRALNGELHLDLEESDFLGVFAMAPEGRARLVGTVHDERAARAEQLGFADVERRALANLDLRVDTVNWFSTYRVHHRVAAHFRSGAVFLAGDAGHIHSPAGGQGMNTGIGDAINLAWKLAAVLQGRADPRLLDSYESERIAFARRLVATTDRAFSFATADGPLAQLVRTRIAPHVFPLLATSASGRAFMFRTVSQTLVHYRGSVLSAGQAGQVHGGDRLPWVAQDGVDNFDALRRIAWQVHVTGTPSARLQAWCAAEGIELSAFAWSPAWQAAGFARDAAYLLRPDGYVAVAAPDGDPDAFDRLFLALGLRR